MFSLSSIILAFFAGILGTLIGGTQTFICTGFVGLLVIIFNHCGIDTTFLNEVISNNLFLTCIIFNAAGLATAYASTKYDIRGVETSRSLAFTNDPYVLLVVALGGILDYLIFDFENYFGFPVDTGAVSVIFDYSLVIAPVVADLCTTPVALSAPPNSYQNNSQS